MGFTDLQWDPDYLFHIGMDGPNVNLKFQEDLKGKFEENSNKTFLDINTRTLHKVHTPFKKGISKLPLVIDQFAVNFDSLFKPCSARRENYAKLQELSEVAAQYVLRHSLVRWLRIKYVVIRIIEQWSNLKE